ncbi:MAG TPA: MraY family glycosyltransferase [Phycisphaeraceae bacterium]
MIPAVVSQAALGRMPGPVGLADVLLPYLWVLIAALVASLVMTPLMRRLALSNGIVDWPDLKRKAHVQPVAYLGGVAILLGWLTGIAVAMMTEPHNNDLTHSHYSSVNFPLSIILGAGVITLTGLFDDVYGISPRVKIGGQLFAAAALAWQDVGTRLAASSLGLLGLHPPDWVTYLLGTFIIAVFVIGGCNSLNLLDGLDGLAAGVTGIATAGFLAIAAILAVRSYDAVAGPGVDAWIDPVRIVMCLAILGAVLGFLPYNFNPAAIFMGDAGSLLLGYLGAATILLFAQTSGKGPLLVTAALIVFALPITDTSLAIIRRKLRGRPIFSPDCEHIHHLLRRSGLSVKQAVGVLYSLAAAFAVLGCSLVMMQLRWRYVLAVFFVMYAAIMVTAYLYGRRLARLENLSVGLPQSSPSGESPLLGATAPTDSR